MKNRFIAVEGNIGVGKTTLAQSIASRLGARLILEEFAHNPLLPAFYADPATHAFPLELSFLADRCEQMRSISSISDVIIISDYLIDKSLVFAKNNLTTEEFALFRRIFQQMTVSLPQPDLILLLHSSVDQLQHNIQQRGRPFEQSIPNEYLLNIGQRYRSHFETLTIPVRVISTDDLSIINNYNDIESLIADLQ